MGSVAVLIFAEDPAGCVLPFDSAAARVDSAAARALADIAASRRRAGQPISEADTRITAIAQPRGAALATRPAMLGDLRIGDFTTKRRQRRVRAFLIRAHQSRIARDIGRQYRRQPPRDPLPPKVHAGDAAAISPFTREPEAPDLLRWPL